VVEGIGRNSFVSSVKPVFCGLYHHSCQHHHIPYIIRSNHLEVQCFFLSIHVSQEFFSSNLCPFL